MNKIILILLVIVASIQLNAQQVLNSYIKGQMDNVPTSMLFSKIESNLKIHIFYNSNWVKDKTVTIKEDSLPLDKVLKKALLFSGLSYVFIEPDIIVIIEKKNEWIYNPEFDIDTLITYSVNDDSEKHIKNNYLKGRKVEEKKTIRVGKISQSYKGKRVKIMGYVYQNDTKEPIIGATIFFKDIKKGAATDADGILEIFLKPGKYSTEFRSMGMQDEKCLFEVFSDGKFKFGMTQAVQNIDEVTVLSSQTYKKRGSQAGLEKISIKMVKQLPTLMGERDIVRISQLLPGVVSVSEASGGINVRGGNADQNMLYINQIPLYNTSHVFGFFTAVNPAIIDDFSMYKGYVPASQGGRLSSILLAESRKGNKHNIFAQGGISPISANLEVEGPIIKEKLSYVVSGRSSYSDWILKRLPNPELRNSSISFYDATVGFDYQINNKNSIQILGYTSHDFFNMNSLNEYEYDNIGLGLRYHHRFSSKFKLDYSLIYSNYIFSSKDWNSISESYSHAYDISHAESRLSMKYAISEKHKLTFGVNNILYNLDRGAIEPMGEQSVRKYSFLGIEQALESSVYVEDEFKLSNKIKLIGGIRYSFYSRFGPDTVNIYPDNIEKNVDNIIDEKIFKKGERVVNYSNPEIRFLVDIKTSRLSSLKLAYNQMSQYMFLLSSSFSIAPTDQWKLADYHIKPGFSQLGSVGYYQTILSLGLTASTEVYYKKQNNILEFKDGADFINTKEVETMTLQGNQNAYGIEFMLAKEEGRLNGWISYTYSRSVVHVDGPNVWDKINNGEKYASNYDKPNVLNIVANFNINRRLIFSSTVTYSTGRPITIPKSIYYIEDAPYVDFSDRNEFRVPDYFRIDVALTLEGNLKKKKLLHSYWMINVYNLTGRKNPYNIYYKSEKGFINGYKYSVIGVPIFTISWNFKLGNYANK